MDTTREKVNTDTTRTQHETVTNRPSVPDVKPSSDQVTTQETERTTVTSQPKP